MTDPKPQSWLNRPIIRGIGLTREQALYILIIAVCLVSRLAMLGYRVQSHDESLHTKFSWDLYKGHGFQHNPMMHGPFLFHITALSYFLFGDNDFTARLPVALMGTALVAFPYLLRRYMGRRAALIASLLLLISPSISYYSRYIRMDIPSLLWVMGVIWAMFRYLEKGQARHLYILAGFLSLLYATKEVAPIYTMIIGAFLVGLFLYHALRTTWERSQAEPVFLASLGGIVLGLLVVVAGWLVARSSLPSETVTVVQEVSPPGWANIGWVVAGLGLLAAAGSILYGMGEKLRDYRSFDLILLIGTLSLPFASPLPIHLFSRLGQSIVARYPDPTMVPPFLSNLATLHPTSYTAPHIYYSGVILILVLGLAVGIGLAWDRRRWPIAAGIYLFIFLTLFTTLFTNGGGIGSGWIGSVGYWLEQQEVERGGQPWYYYLVVLPLYDFMPLLIALATLIILPLQSLIQRLKHLIPSLLGIPSWLTKIARGIQETIHLSKKQSPPPFILFVICWTLLAWAGYSYAGEKMPWLTVHLTLPMILLSGWAVARLLEAVNWKLVWERQGWLILLLLPALIAALAAAAQAARSGPFRETSLTGLMVTGNLLAGIVGTALLGTIVGLVWARV